MTGKDVIIRLNNGNPIAVSTACTINVAQEIEEYIPLPGTTSAEDEEWKHYKPGLKSWSIKNDSFLSLSNQNLCKLVGTEQEITIDIAGLLLVGTGIVVSAKIDAQIGSLAKMSVNIIGNNIPDIA